MNTPTENKMTTPKFEAYERVRQSGVTNMWDVKRVVELSGGELTEDDVLDIIKNYAEYRDIYSERV